MITVTAFKWVPPFAQGLVAGHPRALGARGSGPALPGAADRRPRDQATPEHRARQPFGQVPVLEEDGLVLFESGAIVLHIAERCGR